jgi:UDP-2,3-diacylglucosamine hydrolase
MSSTLKEAQSKPIALFVSDVHLQERMLRTTEAFLRFLGSHASQARRLYILGDLFEYWAGDDDIETEYHRRVINAIRAVSDAGIEVFWIGGNRDFLIGPAFAAAARLKLLPDPTSLELGGLRIVLAHGDEQCTDDLDYMAFRAQVRQPEWQQQFLNMPLAQRKAIIEGLRSGSKEAQRGKSYEIMDVNAAAIADLFTRTSANVMIHGHTHRPGCHQYDGTEGRKRYVLPDWDCDIEPHRGGWLVLDEDGGLSFRDIDGNTVDTIIQTAS